MTSMCCIALICITCHMKRILRTELVLWISAPDMLQQHCLPYEENLKSRASFVDLCTWYVAALPATWRELKKQSFFCGFLCLTCCSIVRENLKLLPCCCSLVGACLQRIVDGFTFKIKSRMQFHDSVHCLPHEENLKSFLCGFMTCPSIAREKLLPCCCHLLGAYSLKKKKIVDGSTLKIRLDAILWVAQWPERSSSLLVVAICGWLQPEEDCGCLCSRDWVGCKSVSLLHCHMKRTSRASSHLDLCHGDLHTTIFQKCLPCCCHLWVLPIWEGLLMVVLLRSSWMQFHDCLPRHLHFLQPLLSCEIHF